MKSIHIAFSEGYSETSQASKEYLLTQIVNNLKSLKLTGF